MPKRELLLVGNAKRKTTLDETGMEDQTIKHFVRGPVILLNAFEQSPLFHFHICFRKDEGARLMI